MGIIVKLNEVLSLLVQTAALFFEFSGVIILVLTGIQALIKFVRRNQFVKLTLLRGMALGLELLLGGEILKTILVADVKELIVVTGLAVLRAALSLLIHWEIKNEEAEYALEEKKHVSGKDETPTAV